MELAALNVIQAVRNAEDKLNVLNVQQEAF
jgi:hypothetical protein